MTDPRIAAEFRVPAISLKPGDLVNTSPGEDDWQEVLSVHRAGGSGGAGGKAGADPGDAAMRTLAQSLDGRYVVVELTDLAPVDSGVYFADDGTAMIAGDDSDGGDQAVADAVSQDDGQRVYLYTRYELVTVRTASR